MYKGAPPPMGPLKSLLDAKPILIRGREVMAVLDYPIKGFGISNFRSFGPDIMYFGPFEKINVIIGSNNSGKSNVLRFVRNLYPSISSFKPTSPKVGDLPQGGKSPEIYPVLAKIDPENEALQPLAEMFSANPLNMKAPHGYAWLDINLNGSVDVSRWFDMERKYDRVVESAYYRIFQNYRGDFRSEWMQKLLQRMFTSAGEKTDIFFVPAYRKLNSRLDEYKDEYGAWDQHRDEKIIDELAAISQPAYNEQYKKKDFRKIVDFLRRVLNEPELELEIPNDRLTITVHLHDKSLPIEALGTGIHELVILASKAVMRHKAIVCIEEPELHFHPELQRQFMRFIHEETDNQYFITTHSAHVMDAVPCSVHRVFLDDGKSKVLRPITGNERRDVCHELGYKPSDLLQSNCIVWVEGPSDRIYVNHWLRGKAPELVEGLHYSVMFYGGALRSHLTGVDALEADLIQLLPINRFPAMIFDSDKKTKNSTINESKRRIKEELNATGLGWMTAGREIENYVPLVTLEAAVQTVHRKAISLAHADRTFGKPLDYILKDGTIVSGGFDKVAIAKEVVKTQADFTILDLERKVNLLVDFIKKANRILATSA